MAKPYATEDQLELLRKLVMNGGSSGKSDLIVVAKDIPLVAEMEESDPDAIAYFTADISKDRFPADFATTPTKYNLIVLVSGILQNDEEVITLGYVANHFCYFVGDIMTTYNCYDQGDADKTIYHFTQMGYDSETNTYKIAYEGKYSGTTMLQKENSKISIYLQQLS